MANPTVLEIIAKKRDGVELQPEELDYLISEILSQNIPDYQIAAWLMAVTCRGMTDLETAALTQAMINSGKQLFAAQVVGAPVADKHSTGGVGDKVSLVVGPLVAACGLHIAKMSGRGLGYTGGTIDKLESIEGLRTELNSTQFLDQLTRHKLVIASQSSELAPADGILYSLRDVTATVPSIPLIASSIMSKKLAIGSSHLMLDVKIGSGAFMKGLDEGARLAQLMVAIGNRSGIKTVAILTNMEQPLGRAVGNALEVQEVIAILQNQGPKDITELCCHEASLLLQISGQASSRDEAVAQINKSLASGAAFQKFIEMVIAQGGNPLCVEEPSRLPTAPVIVSVRSPQSGVIRKVDAYQIGTAAVALGAGRSQKGQVIDHATGLIIEVAIGDIVSAGDVLAQIHARSHSEVEKIMPRVLSAFELEELGVSVSAQELVYRTIGM